MTDKERLCLSDPPQRLKCVKCNQPGCAFIDHNETKTLCWDHYQEHIAPQVQVVRDQANAKAIRRIKKVLEEVWPEDRDKVLASLKT